MKTMKQILTGFLVVAMLVTGLVIAPMDAKATETSEQGEHGETYILDTENYNFIDFWKEDENSRTAPTKSGCVFGGWYKKVNGSWTAITQSEAKTITDGSGIYAKFVPAEVLSVRAQLEAETETNDGANVGAENNNTIAKKTTYLRLLSGVNGLDYQKVGFDIKYNKKHQEESETATNITKVYSSIENSETEAITASSVFGTAATHFSVLRLAEIYKANFEYVIYVTPQWTTLDGTLVEGQSKYVRVIDGYVSNHYISVPINFLAGVGTAAGQLEMQYDKDTLEFVDFDEGVLMPEMSHDANTTGVVKVVGNVDGNADVDPKQDIYANVWFKVKSGVSVAEIPNYYEFVIDGLKFCNWEEHLLEDAEITPWNIKYWN